MRFLIGAILLALASAAVGRSAEPIKPAEFSHLHETIQPQGAESAFLSIGWETDLWRARKQAAAEGKPIVLWEMDGHPLGCT